MRAMLLHELGGPVTLKEVAEPRVGPCDAKVRVRATGVGLTVLIMKSTPGLVTHYPRILGHEVAGEVMEVGSEVRNVKAGDRVACHFYLTLHVCRFCRSGRETLCENWGGYVGMARDGGYAVYGPSSPEPSPPSGRDLVCEASIISDAVATPLHACRAEAKVDPGMTFSLSGAGGGVGIHAVQMAKLCGGRVLAAGHFERKTGDDKEIRGRRNYRFERGRLSQRGQPLNGTGREWMLSSILSPPLRP